MNDLTTHLAKERLSRARASLDELEIRVALGLPDDSTSSDEHRIAGEVRAGLAVIAREVQNKAKSIASNGDLTDSGRTKQLAALAASVGPRIAALKKIVTSKIEGRLTALRAQMTEPLPGRPKDDVVGEVRAGEIRTRLSAMDETQRVAAMWRSVEIGDDETLRAIATAPKSFSLVGADELAKATASYWRKQRPEIAEQISALETISELLDGDFRTMDSAIMSLTGIVPDGPAAEGQTGDETE